VTSLSLSLSRCNLEVLGATLSWVERLASLTATLLKLTIPYMGYLAEFGPTHGRKPVSEMTYTVSSGTLNSTIPYHISRT